MCFIGIMIYTFSLNKIQIHKFNMATEPHRFWIVFPNSCFVNSVNFPFSLYDTAIMIFRIPQTGHALLCQDICIKMFAFAASFA